jgi:uncharacterized membrane protein
MEEIFKEVSGTIALAIEAGVTLLVAFGALEAMFAIVVRVGRASGTSALDRKAIWVRFGVWLLLGLEFALAADIIRSAIAPTWSDIGQLAAIAVIRTFLNYFLESDLEKYASGAEA